MKSLRLLGHFAGKVNNITLDKCDKMGVLFMVGAVKILKQITYVA